jgi:hypothetical protein
VLRIAFDRGVVPGSPDVSQLIHWMEERPSIDLVDAALEAIRVGLSVMPRDEALGRVRRVLSACRAVAESSGGFKKLLHGASAVSRQERSVIDAIRARLTEPRPGDRQATVKEHEVEGDRHDTRNVRNEGEEIAADE